MVLFHPSPFWIETPKFYFRWSCRVWKVCIVCMVCTQSARACPPMYRYIPCMNRVSTNPKCAYSFFNFDAITMSSHVTSMRECTNIGKSPWNVIKLLYVYTAIRIVYRDMHYLKHVYTAIRIVYRRTAGGQDSRCIVYLIFSHSQLEEQVSYFLL